MKQKTLFIVFTLIFTLLVLSGCSSDPDTITYKSGTYVGKSSEDDRGAYGEATITIDDGKITDCEYVTWQKDGTPKDENYGKVNDDVSNEDYYKKAQVAVAAMKQYAEKLVEVQKLKDVEAISGATVSFNQFNEAVNDALDKAKV
ncbi:FMN-binding protein [Clostridium aminobutyricum]|uniref:FMN-binding protein n=1 Tax=Clostridium aminobutyricum TaxID=33953 RepID=A0A939D9I7_CLOAM|nr:FMN-binding protein [Clostridium aminobutyricum]MBN7773243.1 FMN-binding protein [Clostridium aminobutyricum]